MGHVPHRLYSKSSPRIHGAPSVKGLHIILPDFDPHPPVDDLGMHVVAPFQMACKSGPVVLHVDAVISC